MILRILKIIYCAVIIAFSVLILGTAVSAEQYIVRFINTEGWDNMTGYGIIGAEAMSVYLSEFGVYRGDINGDGKTNISDAVYLMWTAIGYSDYALPVYVKSDYNGDGYTDVSDAVYLLWHIFYPDEYPLIHEKQVTETSIQRE